MSNPSSIQIPDIHVSLTSDMMLGLKPSAPSSRAYRVNIAPNNKQLFTPSDMITIDIPTSRPNTWYDPSQSYLKFSVQLQSANATAITNLGADGIFVDNTAYSFFQRLDVYNGSNQLETITQYGGLANTLLDISLTQSDKASLSSLFGCNPYTVSSGLGVAPVANTGISTVQTAGDRSGLTLSSAAAIANGVAYTFCLPLLSGVIGANASKMIPIGDLRAPITIQLYTSANDDAICYGIASGATIWQIINVEYIATFVEIQDSAYQTHLQPEIPYYISTKSWRESGMTIPANTTGEFTNILAFRMASICNILGRFRNNSATAQAAAGGVYRTSSSINPNLSYYYFKVGSQTIPNKPVYLVNGAGGVLVGTGNEGFAELLKSMHALTSTYGNSAITYNQYNVAQAAQGNFIAAYAAGALKNHGLDTSNNAFCIGQELESFAKRSDTILSGMSTLNTNLFFTAGVVNGQNTGGANIVAEFYAQYDLILVIQEGYITSKY